jgi:hypothetical protein
MTEASSSLFFTLFVSSAFIRAAHCHLILTYVRATCKERRSHSYALPWNFFRISCNEEIEKDACITILRLRDFSGIILI